MHQMRDALTGDSPLNQADNLLLVGRVLRQTHLIGADGLLIVSTLKVVIPLRCGASNYGCFVDNFRGCEDFRLGASCFLRERGWRMCRGRGCGLPGGWRWDGIRNVDIGCWSERMEGRACRRRRGL